MKATLEFNLDFNDDEVSFRESIDGYKYKFLLWDITQKIRSKLKYGELKSADEELEELQTFIFDELSEKGVTLD